jgi:hypothetical protein
LSGRCGLCGTKVPDVSGSSSPCGSRVQPCRQIWLFMLRSATGAGGRVGLWPRWVIWIIGAPQPGYSVPVVMAPPAAEARLFRGDCSCVESCCPRWSPVCACRWPLQR